MVSYTFPEIAVTVLVGIALVIVTYYKWSFQYFKRRNFTYKEGSIPFGSITNPLRRKEAAGVRLRYLYEEARSQGWKFVGVYIFASPNVAITDLDQCRNILTKDFQYFTDRGFYYNEKDDPLSAHLFAIGGKKWRNLRTKLTPTFTSGKMKMMFQTLVDCEKSLQEALNKLCQNCEPIDIKEIMGCFTTDIIGSCAFGLELNSFKETDSPFRYYGKKSFKSGRFKTMLTTFAVAFPKLARSFGIRQLHRDVADFYMKIVKETVDYREKNNITRKDFLQLLIDLKNNTNEEYNHDGKTLTIEEVAAQSYIFFFAGFETSSTTMTFTLYELARHQEIQDKVRAEINDVLAKHNYQITYDSINELKYMNQIIDETLRIYPPVPMITRKCVKDYKVPGEDLVIEKGITVFIPILGIHNDPEMYPNPAKFDPDRFSEENKRNRHPYSHIPFGEGPRICIGMRFGLMQTKVGLTAILKNYKLTVNPKTKEPIQMDPLSFIPSVIGDIWLSAEKI